MLRFFRGFAKSWFGPAIMGVLVIAFAIFGSTSVRGLFNGHLSDSVVSAGDHQVTQAQFRQVLQQYEQDYQTRTGQPFSPQEAVKQGFDQQIVQSLAAESAYSEMLRRAGVRPTDTLIADWLKRAAESGKSPGLAQVFDSVTGKFRPDALRQLLQSNGLTEDQFERELTDQIANEDFASAIAGGFKLPGAYASVEAALLLESRDVTYFVIPLSTVPMPKPTDAELLAFVQQNKAQLTLPERRVMTIVQFSAKALAPTMQVPEADIEKQFEANKAGYGKPELRSFFEIPLKDPRDAQKVEAGLRSGEDPAAVGRSVGAATVAYADQPLTAVADRKAGEAAFAMKPGEVSGPVQGDFQIVILKVTKATPQQAPDIAAARPQIEADLRQSKAVQKVYDLSQKFDDLRQGGASLADAASKLGLTPVTIGPITQDGRQLGGPPSPAADQRVLATGFQLSQGGDSDVEQDAVKGEFFSVHVDRVVPPGVPDLTEPGGRDVLTRFYVQRTVVSDLQKKAADAQAAIQKGQTFSDAAAPYHATLSHQLGLQQATAQQYQQTLGTDFLGEAFEAKSGQVFIAGSDPLKGMVVARVDAIHSPTAQQVASAIPAVRQKMSQDYIEGLQPSIREAAQKLIRPTINLALARTAMGVDAGTAAAGGAGTGTTGR